MNLFSPRHRLTFAAVSFACAMIAPAAQANHSWNGYHWGSTSPTFTLKLGDNVSSAWDGILATTSSDWSVSAELDTTIVAGVPPKRYAATDCGERFVYTGKSMPC